MAELEIRVEILEGTAEDHETRISTTESNVNGRSDFTGKVCGSIVLLLGCQKSQTLRYLTFQI